MSTQAPDESFPEGVEGRAKFKEFETWYVRYGDLNSTSGRTPLIIIHGGPGASHHYLKSCIDLYTKYGIPLVLYDQIGVSNSNDPEWKLHEKPVSFWTTELFMDELENLVEHLGIQDNYDLLGQSWGGLLATQFAADRQPKGLRRLVAASTTPSIKLFLDVVAPRLVDALPAEHRDAIRKHEKEGTYGHPDYLAAVQVFFSRHIYRLPTLPKAVQQTMDIIQNDGHVYRTMNGPSEFTIIGPLKDYNILDRMHTIKASCLLIHGEYDEAADDLQWPLFKHVEKIKWVTLQNASHFCFWEERELFMRRVADFLTMP